MKILHVTPGFYPTVGGIQKYVEDLCIDLNKLGHQSDVITFDRHTVTGEKLKKYERYNGINVYRLPLINLKYYNMITNIPRFVNIVKKYDVVHVYGVGNLSDLLGITKKIHGKPLIVSTVGGIFHTKNMLALKDIYFNFWCRLMLKAADKIVAISDHDKKLFSKISVNIRLIPVPVETERFRFRERKKSNLTMVTIGRISRNKRVDRLIDIVKIMARDEPKVKLYIIGNDYHGLRGSLEKQAASGGAGKNVEFLGEVSDKYLLEYMNKSTFFLSASEYESFGISAVEAMASGLVVVLNDIDSFRYFVRNGENGYIADYSKPAEVAELIKKLNKTPLSGISRKALERVNEFRRENITRLMEKLYAETVKAARKQ